MNGPNGDFNGRLRDLKAARGDRICFSALPGHQHQAEIGDRVRFILLRGPQEKETGAAVICRTSKAVETHKSKIKQPCRMLRTCRLMVISSCSNKILPHTTTGVQHGTIIVRCCNMARISSPAHKVRTTKQCVAAPV